MTIESMSETRSASTGLCIEFLNRLQAGDLDGACSLLAPDVEYVNVSLPTIRGRDDVRKALGRMMGLKGAGFEVVIHRDPMGGEAVARPFAAKVPGSTLEMMPGGHAVWVDDPGHVADSLTVFLRG